MTDPNPNPNPNPAPADASARPEFIPEKFWDDTAKSAKIEDLAKAYSGLEQKLGKGKEAWEQERFGKRPQTPDEYKIEIEGFDAEVIGKSPLVPVIKKVAHDMGVSVEEAGAFAKPFFDALISAAPNPDEEFKALGDNAEARLKALDAGIQGLTDDPAERQAFEMVATTAAGVKALEKLFAKAGGLPTGAVREETTNGQPTGKSESEIKKLMEDPRYWDPRKRDPLVVKEVEDWYKAQYK